MIDFLSGLFALISILVVLSYYFLLFKPQPRFPLRDHFKSITVIIPAHNEAPYLDASIRSVLRAVFPGERQVIVVDDGSIDETAEIAKRHDIILLRNRTHSGKSYSLNKALQRATGDLIAIVDGDSIIEPGALVELAREIGRERMGGVCGVVKVKNRSRHINMWVHLELLYASLVRGLYTKIGANITTPGALSMYRRDALEEVKGFSTQGFSEDVDIAIKLIRSGYRIGFSERAISETNMPYDLKGFLRQRTRFARGLVFILKRHLQMNRTIIDLYTLPLFLFIYVQSVVMGVLTIYKLASGYFTYFASQGLGFSLAAAQFFFEWFSIIGFAKWTWTVLSGSIPLSLINVIGVISSLLSYPLYLYAIAKYDRVLDWRNLVAVAFMFPFWLIIMVIHIISLPEILRREQYNIWKKNEP